MSNFPPHYRQLLLKFTLPVAGLVGLLLAASLVGVIVVADYQTRVARQQEVVLAEGAVGIRREQIEKTALDYGTWDEAVDNLVSSLNVRWADANIGEWTFSSLGFAMAFVVAPDGTSSYGAIEGKRTDRAIESVLEGRFDLLVARQRAGDAHEASSGLILADGVPSIAVVAPIRYFTPGRETGGPQTLLVLVDTFTPQLLGELARTYLLPNLHIATAAAPGAVQAELRNGNNDVIGALAWDGARPGDTLLKTAVPLWGALTSLFALLAALILRQAGAAAKMIGDSEWRARHDSLTGLPNRVLFFERLDAAARLAAEGGPGFALLYLDLDGFKHVNDVHGHEAGDIVLKIVSQRVLAEVDGGDVVARLGGDEFSLMLHGRLHPARIQALGQRVLKAIRQPIRLDSGTDVTVGATIGVTIAPGDNTDPLLLLRQADEALFLGKRSGKQQIQFYTALAARKIG